MKKGVAYRVAGMCLTLIGIASQLITAVVGFVRAHGHLSFGANILGSLVVMLVTLPYNFLCWLGLILLWRADRVQRPDRISKWGWGLIALAIWLGITIVILSMFYLRGAQKYGP